MDQDKDTKKVVDNEEEDEVEETNPGATDDVNKL